MLLTCSRSRYPDTLPRERYSIIDEFLDFSKTVNALAGSAGRAIGCIVNNTPNHMLTKQVFMWDWKVKKRNWSSEIRSILEDIDMVYLKDCTTINEFHRKEILVSAQKLLMAKEKEKWVRDLKNQAKLRTYREFKTEFLY